MDAAPKTPISFRLPQSLIDRLSAEANERDVTQTEFVTEALREKFDRIDTGTDKGWGPMAGLPDADRGLAIKMIECLRLAPEGKGFRRAVDANLSWLIESCR